MSGDSKEKVVSMKKWYVLTMVLAGLAVSAAAQKKAAEARKKLLDAIKRLPPNLTPEEGKKRGQRHAEDNPDLVRWLQSLGEIALAAAFAIIMAIVLVAAWEAAAAGATVAFIAGFVTVALNRNRETRS